MVSKNYNFFYPYIRSTRRIARLRLLAITFSLSVIGGLLIGYLFDYLYIREMENRFATLRNEISIIEKNPNIRKYEETVTKFEILNQFNEIAEIIDNSIDSTDVIDIKLFGNLDMCIPDQIQITSMAINMYEITLQGNGNTLDDIGTLEYNLRSNTMFEDIHVSVISRNMNTVTFSAMCMIKDVEANEAE